MIDVIDMIDMIYLNNLKQSLGVEEFELRRSGP